jgi:DNA-binding CsgD family transcriptional regulator
MPLVTFENNPKKLLPSMENLLPPDIKANNVLRARLTEKLNYIHSIQNELSSVVIIHDIRDSTVVYMSERGLKTLGVTLEDLRIMATEYYQRYFNIEDAKDYVPKILGLLQRNNNEEMVSYFQQVRPSELQDWSWYASCTKIFFRDEAGQPLLTITNSIPIDAQHYFNSKVERLLQENTFLRNNKHAFALLTMREKEILKLLAQGLSSLDIAARLFISEATVNTHRRNLRSKLNAETPYDIIRFAQAFDLI